MILVNCWNYLKIKFLSSCDTPLKENAGKEKQSSVNHFHFYIKIKLPYKSHPPVVFVFKFFFILLI